MVSFIIGTLVIAITFYVGMVYTSVTLILLGFAEVALMMFAGICLLYRRCKVYCFTDIPISMTEPGNKVNISLSVVNYGKITWTRSKYHISYWSTFSGKKKKVWFKGPAVFPGENEFVTSVLIDEAGNFVFLLDKIRIYDMTGLFYISKKVNKNGNSLEKNLKVLPKIQEISVQITESVKNFYGEADVYDSERPGHDNSEVFKIRPFQNGDKMQSIHWKLSAKMDTMMVRESSFPKACPIILYLHYVSNKRTKTKRVDIYLTIVASISFSMMDEGCPHFVAWYSESMQDIVRFRVEDEESLYTFLNYFLEDGCEKKSHDLKMLYRDKYRNENYLHSLEFNEKLELKCDDRDFAVFSRKNWQKEIKELEIIV